MYQMLRYYDWKGVASKSPEQPILLSRALIDILNTGEAAALTRKARDFSPSPVSLCSWKDEGKGAGGLSCLVSQLIAACREALLPWCQRLRLLSAVDSQT